MIKIRKTYLKLLLFLLTGFFQVTNGIAAEPDNNQDTTSKSLRLATFDVDATPPVGSLLVYDPMINTWDMGLRARGVVLLGAGQPIVMCAIDWIGIGNGSQDEFRFALAEAAGTIPDRVVVHTVHQHDAPVCDFSGEQLLKNAGLNPLNLNSNFARDVMHRLEIAVRYSLEHSQKITHVGFGEAPVFQVASNRRLLGPDGRVRATRSSTCKDPALRAEPEGIIDPMVSVVSFWNADSAIAVMSYYAVHPQSYYRTGQANPDFPGIARFYRQLAVPGALHVHFNGAGGNISAGKYNDGSKENRGILAERLADGMKRAWEATIREPITSDEIKWTLEPVALPPAKYLEKLQSEIKMQDTTLLRIYSRQLAWIQRCQAGKKINVDCLTLGRARILYLPGELCIEYQLAAKAERKDLFVAVAAYGDFGPGYICTAIAYTQGGYEDGPASNVSPEVESVLMRAIRKLLNDKP